jgi:hypothetical protein
MRRDTVRFIELNPVSARLVALLQEAGASGTAACARSRASCSIRTPPP